MYPNPMRDVGAAMLYIKENADASLVDADKIVLCGFSAGGHNSAMYATHWDKPVMTEHFGVEAGALRPAACILGYAVTDYFAMKDTAYGDPITKALHSAFNMAYFGVGEPTEEMLQKASPARLVDKSFPPAFLWATRDDGLVPVGQTTRLATALADNGIPFEAHIFEGGPHGLSLATEATAGAKGELDGIAARWIEFAAAWLRKRFAPELPELRPWQQGMDV
jgi:acetyl esterase/lipase